MTDIGGISGDPRWRTEWTSLPTREEASRPGTLRIDRDKIPQAIALFSKIKQRMDQLYTEAAQALWVAPMAEDRVSVYIADVLTAKGLSDPECALNAILAFSRQLQDMVDRLEETHRLMSTTEDSNRRGLQGGRNG
ncbi:PE domain-containing protein [Allokutzneria albata]|uniref:PE family protein n=1 Tax=Allokutzneria albata TaxID=211114 RepID=A0A1H0A7A3_ALLAB|nr:PE domain-containing protein [Allokutzneria albata]SDN29622.1 PE family protein [Allokutzneria albata]